MRLVFTDAAERDFEAIGDFIARDNPRRAEAFVEELRESCLDLTTMPARYPVVSRLQHLRIRRRVHGRYLIFYRVSGEKVEILHILNGAMEYEKLLFPGE